MEKFVVIGTGFIGGYMGKGMRNVAGTDNLQNIAYGIKGHNRDVDKKRLELGYDVSVNNTADVLDRVNPTVIIFSAPPEKAPEIVTDILAPYYETCRKNNIRLPDLYSFIPSPSADWMCEKLGGDANVVKILPNILDNVCGYDLSPIGINYISYAYHQWTEDRKEVLKNMLAPYGYTARTSDVDSLVLLAGKITSHVCYEVSYTIKAACDNNGLNVALNSIGSSMRKAQYDILPQLPVIGRCDDKDIPDALKPFFRPFMEAWYKGLRKFTIKNKDIVSDEDAEYIDMCSFALNVFPIQYKTKAELELDTKNAATKGGILERGIEFFFEAVEEKLRYELENILKGQPASEDFFIWVEEQSYKMSCEAYERSLDLSGKK